MQEKRLVQETQTELQKSQESISQLTAEVAFLQNQKETLTTKCTEERSHVTMLEQQIATMQKALTDARQNEVQYISFTLLECVVSVFILLFQK